MPSQPRVSLNILGELRKVSWPSRQDTIKLTVVVIVASVFVGLYIGVLDVFFAQLLRMATQ
ncbi:MAG TPA: preprotein translocase subunit SecE [Candidatus Woesebacteria bacterium]|nr:preprotein translocase subunit SecE [Candidatus Woesebacteria bacterium]